MSIPSSSNNPPREISPPERPSNLTPTYLEALWLLTQTPKGCPFNIKEIKILADTHPIPREILGYFQNVPSGEISKQFAETSKEAALRVMLRQLPAEDFEQLQAGQHPGALGQFLQDHPVDIQKYVDQEARYRQEQASEGSLDVVNHPVEAYLTVMMRQLPAEDFERITVEPPQYPDTLRQFLQHHPVDIQKYVAQEARYRLEGALNEYVAANLSEPQRKEVRQRIINAIENKSSEITLTDLDISELPELMYCGADKLLNSTKELFVSRNNLQRLPDWITQLENLETLVCDDNPLDHLPDITKLQHLDTLSIRNTAINELPDELFKIKTMNQILMEGAPLASNMPTGTMRTRREDGCPWMHACGVIWNSNAANHPFNYDHIFDIQRPAKSIVNTVFENAQKHDAC